jgi:DNA-binding beta-propeller fold protein YncE
MNTNDLIIVKNINVVYIPRHKHIRMCAILILLITQYAIAQDKVSLVECPKTMELMSTPDGNIRMPSDVALDEHGRIYVVDSGNHRVVVFAKNGEFLLSYGKEGNGAGELYFPVGITVTKSGKVLVADRGNRRIQVYGSDGKYIETIKGSVGDQQYTPVDVAVSQNEKDIYISATSPLHQILKLDRKGKVLEKWGHAGDNEGEFRYPATIALSRENNEVYIVDVLNTRVQVFDNKGKYLVTVGSWGVSQGQLFRPKGVALTHGNEILVSDSYLGVVQLYNSDTRFKAVLSMQGDIARFTTPSGIAVDKTNRVYIAEPMANRVTVCQLKTL